MSKTVKSSGEKSSEVEASTTGAPRSSERRRKIITYVVSLLVVVLAINQLDTKSQYFFVEGINGFFTFWEDLGLVDPPLVYDRNWEKDYPELKVLYDNYDVIREEAEGLLEIKNKMKLFDSLTNKTRGETVQWRPFMLKFMTMMHENEKYAPKTYELIKNIPGVYISHLSFLDPKQHIKQHYGYYMGYLTFHLGIIIPNNNEDKSCYLRVNPNIPYNHENVMKTKEGGLADEIAAGEHYYWHNGEAVLFSDMYLHDAQNNSDEVRVVLFMDIERKFPWALRMINKFFLFLASIPQPEIRKTAIFNPDPEIST